MSIRHASRFAPTAFAAVAFLVWGVKPADAGLDFTFSVTNTIGTVSGTFQGEVFGLIDNSTSSATSVVIQTIPSGMNNLITPPIEATLWDQQDQNSFTVSNGQIVGGGFWAQQTIGGFPQGYQLYLNGSGSGFNFLNLDGVDHSYVWGNNGLAAANFTPAGPTVPEPASLISTLLGTALVAGWRFRRNRRLSA